MSRASRDVNIIDNTDPVLVWRFGRGKEGWGLRYGFNWFSSELHQPVLGQPQSFGRLRLRPMMIGYGYGLRHGRMHVSYNLKGGYAISSLRVRASFVDAYRSSLNISAVHADVRNSFVVKPEMTAWIDLTRTIGLQLSAGYMIVRPEIVLTGAAGIAERRRIHADTFIVQLGAAYSIF